MISASQADSDIDIESIPLPPSVLNRTSASFRHHNDSTMDATFKSRSTISGSLNEHHATSTKKLQTNRNDGNKFKLADILNNQKNKITSIDMYQYPAALNHLNATLKQICRSNGTPSLDRLKECSFDHSKRMPFESFSIDANTYHELVAKNQPIPMDVRELRDIVGRPSMNNLTSNTMASVHDIHSVHDR